MNLAARAGTSLGMEYLPVWVRSGYDDVLLELGFLLALVADLGREGRFPGEQLEAEHAERPDVELF